MRKVPIGLTLLLVAYCLTGCGNWWKQAGIRVQEKTEAKQKAKERQEFRDEADALLRALKVGRGYQPIDPITVRVLDPKCTNKQILDSLPNEAMRLAVGQRDASGNVYFGGSTLAVENSKYLVVIDYIKYRSRSLLVKYRLLDPVGCEEKSNEIEMEKRASYVRLACRYHIEVIGVEKSVEDGVADAGDKKHPGGRSDIELLRNWQYTYIPFYVGVGVRMIASVTALKGSVDLSSPFGLGAAGQANQISGGLLVQTLGASGEAISPLIPIPSELNVTTIQNAIMALATVKSKMYETANVMLSPQIVAIDDFVATQGSKDVIVSGLYKFLKDLQF